MTPQPFEACRTLGAGKLVHLEAGRGIDSIIVLVHHFSLTFADRIKAPASEGGCATPRSTF